MRLICVLIGSLLLSACTQVKMAAVNIAQFTFDGEVVRNVSVGRHPRQSLDVFVPETQLTGETFPVVMFVHGGRWTSGERTDYAFIGAKLAEQGYITVVPSYRQYPHVKLPEMMDDIAAAAAWTQKNVGVYNAQMDNIFLMGHSSGAHMAALLLADERYLKKHSMTPDMFNAFVGLAGPYHFTPTEPDLVDLFGPEKNYPSMQVSTFIDGDEPPMLLLHGLIDETVLVGNMERLSNTIKSKNGQVQTRLYRDYDHEKLLQAFTWAGKKQQDIMADVDSFLRSHSVQTGILVRPGVARWQTYRGVSGY